MEMGVGCVVFGDDRIKALSADIPPPPFIAEGLFGLSSIIISLPSTSWLYCGFIVEEEEKGDRVG
jgi:hypothetical protein